MTPDLASLQRWMKWAITEPHGLAAALASGANGEPEPRLLDVIVGTPALNRVDRLDIYAEAYFARIVDALAADFELSRKLLGERDFRRLIADYLMEHPSRVPCIGDVGAALPEFAKSHALAAAYPWLSDLAALERALIKAFYADDRPLLDPERLKLIPESSWESARIELDASVTLLTCDWPVAAWWQRRDSLADDSEFVRLLSTQTVLVFRENHVPMAIELTTAQTVLLQAFAAGHSFEAAMELFSREAASETGAEAALQSWFAAWVARGVIREVITGGMT